MLVLVIGGSGSGKSAYGEDCITSLSPGKKKYYLAAMKVFDEEDRQKVDRHRQMRQGKGFVTIEQTVGIEKALLRMEPGARTALVECVSNLTANEMFSEHGIRQEEDVAEKIADGILKLKKAVDHLVVISGNVFEDGRCYDEGTMAYIRAMGRINERLAREAERVVEVVVGIPVAIKLSNAHKSLAGILDIHE